MPAKIDITGQRFGRLTVKKEAGRDKQGKILWECLCVCGNIKIIAGNSLRLGRTQSCGCLHLDNHTKHGMYGTPTYKSWGEMIQRCTNQNNEHYQNYGGRGIDVCEFWLKFKDFFEDMGECPKGLTIERKNNELGYFKDNCCWATRSQQARNRRIPNRSITGAVGVNWYKNDQKYVVRIMINGKRYCMGSFETIEQAIIVRKKAEQLYWGDSYVLPK